MSDSQRHRQSDTKGHSPDPLTAASEAVRDLKEALAAFDIALPSLRVDFASCTVRTPTPRPLVEMGRCNLETARRLTAVLRKAARP